MRRLFPFLVVAAGLLAYANSFDVPFVFDEQGAILENESIRRLWPLSIPLSPPRADGITTEGRPLLNLSFAVNYAFGQLDPRGYHVVNLAIHLLAGLALIGVLRRSLRSPVLRAR